MPPLQPEPPYIPTRGDRVIRRSLAPSLSLLLRVVSFVETQASPRDDVRAIYDGSYVVAAGLCPRSSPSEALCSLSLLFLGAQARVCPI